MDSKKIMQVFERGEGVFKLNPVFVPRRFSRPGKRLRLHPDDYFALGTARGGIKERWFSSTIRCMNGPLAAEDEGLSYVSAGDGEKFLLLDAVETLKARLVGEEVFSAYGCWPMYSKFFDNELPLFHHLHLGFEDAARVGRLGKPEAYYYPPQYNNYAAEFPHTYFGFDPDVSKEEVRNRLLDYETRDTRITELSRAYRIQLGTGWYTPPGVLHAPGSYLTYEPQWNSDVNSVYENITSGEVYDRSFLNENCPPEKKDDVDYIMSLMDWEKNVDPHYRKHYFRPPVSIAKTEDYELKWVVYGNGYIAAQELTVYPDKTVRIADDFAYGCIFVQGHGKFGAFNAETAGMLRFGQESQDEYFVSAEAAKRGILVQNASHSEPIVILKHFPANQVSANVKAE